MSFGTGAACFVGGIRLARQPGLRRFVWAPAAVGVGVVVVLLVAGYGWIRAALVWAVEWLPSWLDWLVPLLAPVLYLLGIVVGGWLFGLIAVVAASPFLGTLAARAERAAFGDAPAMEEGLAAALAKTCRRELGKLAYHLPRLLALLLLLPLVPVVNLATPLLLYAFGAWMLALQFTDYAAENRGLPFAETRALLGQHRAAALGFGALAALALAIPLAAPFVVPAGVCGGALLWRRLTTGDQPVAVPAGSSGDTG